MRYFTNYYTARKLAEKRGLVEREYGDTGYMLGCEPLSYCEWNKSGSRDDEAEIVVYYGWETDGERLIPERKSQAKRIREIVKYRLGVLI